MGDGDVGETAGWRVGHARARRARQGAPRPLLLEVDADTAARGVLERLLGLVGEIVEPDTASEGQDGTGERVGFVNGR